jgi:hypothetical protein
LSDLKISASQASAFAVLMLMTVVGAAAWIIAQGRWATMPFLAGAAGWMIAMALRIPAALLAKRRDNQRILVAASGPAEESVRLVLVLLAATTVWDAGLIGFGWATIEIAQTVATGFALVKLSTATDEKAIEAREQMRTLGMDRVSSVHDGVFERAAASAFHVAATLAVFSYPLLVLVLIPIHSMINIGVLAALKRSPNRYRLSLAVMLAASLAAGLLVTR